MPNISPWSPPNWSPQQQAYIAWLALPKRDRLPKNETALASQLNVDRRTLHNWRNLPALRAEVNKLCRALIGGRLAEVLESLENSALSGSTPHQRLYFELLSMIGPGKNNNSDHTIPPGVKVLIGVDLDKIGKPEPKPNPPQLPPPE